MSKCSAVDDAVYEEVPAKPAVEGFSIGDNDCYVGIKPAPLPAPYFRSGNRPQVPAKETRNRKVTICLFFVLVALLFSACIVFSLLISNLKSEIAALRMASSIQQPQIDFANTVENLTQQISDTNNLVHQQLSFSHSALSSSINLSHQQFSQDYSALENRTQQLIMETQLLFDALERPGLYSFHPVPSCAALPPASPSGYYWVRAYNGSSIQVYCDMTRSCGGVTGGWARVAKLDMSHMTNSSGQCPSGFTRHSNSCALADTVYADCSSVIFSSAALQYSKVCGKIKAYQFGSTDAFFHHQVDIDSYYVDGVSLTHGNPKMHIWTFAAALDEVGTIPESNCPCTNTDSSSSTTQAPTFVGADYFCDTGSEGRIINNHLYGDDPLWDGAGCGPLNTCCSFNNPPWFFKQLPQPTADDIEMRVCRSQSGENIVTELVEIYIQ